MIRCQSCGAQMQWVYINPQGDGYWSECKNCLLMRSGSLQLETADQILDKCKVNNETRVLNMFNSIKRDR